MKIIIQANEIDNWNLSLIWFRYESTAVKESGKLFWSWRSAVPGQRVRTTRQGAAVSILNQTTNGSILFSCHLPSHVTEVENDIPTGNGIFFFSERRCHDLNRCDSPNITCWNTYCQIDSFSRWELRDMIRSWSGFTVFLKWPPGAFLVLYLMG